VGQEQYECRGEEDRPAGHERPEAEVLTEFPVVRLHREKNRGQEGEQRQRQQTHAHGERGEPWLDKLRHEAARVHRSHSAGRNRADRDPQEDWGDNARTGEDPSPMPLGGVPASVVGAEGERRPPQHDAHQHQRQRNVKDGSQTGVDRREAGECEDDRQNEPDVIRLPDGADGMGDDFALALTAGTGGQQIPDAAPEIGAAE
jgi:hypothetical protein